MDELGRSPPVGHVEDPHVAAHDLRELSGARIVRPQRAPDAQQVRPQPERVAALDRPGRRDPARRRDARSPGPALEDGGLALPVRLAGSEGNRPAIRNQQRIERVDQVRIGGLLVQHMNGRAEPVERLHEHVVLALGPPEIDRSQEAVGWLIERPPEGRTRPLHEDVAQGGGHALGAVAPRGQRHGRRIPSAPGFPSAVPRRRLWPMSAYAATARIGRVAPRLVIGRVTDGDDDAAQYQAIEPVGVDVGLTAVGLTAVHDRDPLVERLAAARDRWSQLTFYLFDAEGWR